MHMLRQLFIRLAYVCMHIRLAYVCMHMHVYVGDLEYAEAVVQFIRLAYVCMYAHACVCRRFRIC